MPTRDENLDHLLGFRQPDPSAWCVPEALPRWAAVESDGFGEQSWIAFFETQEEAIDYFFSGEGDWFPAFIYDLDEARAYKVNVTCEVGEEVPLL